ncbi:heterodisulfide reductase-related iron-sulfur binding cluster [Solirubrobacter ginsenosidimutans]|uniref:Glycolate oxidase iron-sulfur subunit n=1 Tax=Solirubrobacter ginsenosidimutans TaxID=490573 RepID=A0A9X3MZL3_9ACTN|nr:heterodisulfide reductase-related iron-sulfur binding cluster [Solirubrobacter ginsenosidimutans]MDA0164137.1 heterodisulfide reductase-related iron-sulfur binding cluster [Solirubrobacter ginsenosidimutans]
MSAAWDTTHPPDPDLIKDCVHCGFCLPTCPSYAVFEDEMDSPRGRIVLMKVGHEEGSTISPEMVTHFDRCLGCMACVTACPSGVQYDKLIERTRPQLERSEARTWQERAYKKAIFAVFTHPARLRALAPGAKLGPKLAPLVPTARLKSMLSLAPSKATYRPLPKVKRSPAPVQRGRVAFMQGCIQRVFFGDVNAATVRVLTAEGFEVHSPRSPRCCGALQMHSGVEEEALPLAEATIAAYEGFDHIVTNVAGCGSVMKDYGHLLDTDRAREFSAKVVDVHEFLAAHEPQAVRKPIELRAAYHDACHLAHAQKVRLQPRELLRGIPGIELLEPAEWELCCGSAGIYNLLQPEAAAKLGARKADNLRATGAEAIAAANPGCALQIAKHLDLPIYHPMTLLDMSLRGVKP